jgi:CRP-like cAMP-binding protein
MGRRVLAKELARIPGLKVIEFEVGEEVLPGSSELSGYVGLVVQGHVLALSTAPGVLSPYYGAVYSSGSVIGEFQIFLDPDDLAVLTAITPLILAAVPVDAVLSLATDRPSLLASLHWATISKLREDHRHRRAKARLPSIPNLALILTELGRVAGIPVRHSLTTRDSNNTLIVELPSCLSTSALAGLVGKEEGTISTNIPKIKGARTVKDTGLQVDHTVIHFRPLLLLPEEVMTALRQTPEYQELYDQVKVGALDTYPGTSEQTQALSELLDLAVPALRSWIERNVRGDGGRTVEFDAWAQGLLKDPAPSGRSRSTTQQPGKSS